MALLNYYEQFYQQWTHPHLKASVFNEHISRQMLALNLIGLISYLLLLVPFVWWEYGYGILSCLFGVFCSMLTFLLLRYSSNLKFNFYFSLTYFLFVIFIASFGIGGIKSVFSLGYIFMIWGAFYYEIKAGIIWISFLSLWLSFWVFMEFNGFEFPQTFPEQFVDTFNLIYVLMGVVLYTLVFISAKLNEERLLKNLEHSKQLLFKKDKMASLGQLTAGIAHEINNPMNFINGSAEALELDFKDLQKFMKAITTLENQLPSERNYNDLLNLAQDLNVTFLLKEIADLIEGVKSGGERVSKIVNGLKTFAHQSDGTFETEDITILLESALVILNNKIKQKEIQVIKSFEPLPKIPCQAGKLNQVFLNIIDNAVDAMNVKGLLEIKTTAQNNKVLISINDNGKGIDEVTRQRLFEPFFTTKEIGKGTGLGLYISYGIIQQHNGEIEVNSTPGEGTAFVVRLPVSSE